MALNLQPSQSLLLEQNRKRLHQMGFQTDDHENITAVPPEHPVDAQSVIASVHEILSEQRKKTHTSVTENDWLLCWPGGWPHRKRKTTKQQTGRLLTGCLPAASRTIHLTGGPVRP